VYSPKTVFQECLHNKIINKQEIEKCENMITYRNSIIENYSPETEEEIIQEIPYYYELMRKIAEKTKP